ncbi:hypothetical protein EDC04DRAFT_1034943 [Pisolithus marmoratus]|nr:hypothetical protein EDC04DRAFT_1034943 [Pisolithus marmoratus]
MHVFPSLLFSLRSITSSVVPPHFIAQQSIVVHLHAIVLLPPSSYTCFLENCHAGPLAFREPHPTRRDLPNDILCVASASSLLEISAIFCRKAL